jgi:hypothetical protein
MLLRRSLLGGLAASAIGGAAVAEPCGEEERRKLLRFGEWLVPEAQACGGGGGGTGPAASGTFSADFTNLTGRTAPTQLFGMATGGLGNSNGNGLTQSGGANPFADVAAFPLLRSRVKALNLPLIRLHSAWIPGGAQDTWNNNYLVNLVNNVADLWSPSTVVVLGIACQTLNSVTFQNFTKNAITYWNANAPAGYKIAYVECMNERDDLSPTTYANCFNGMVAGAQQADSTIKGTGPASAGFVNGTGQLDAIINSNTAATFGFGNNHQYMYCPGCGDSVPSDQTVMLSNPGPNDIGSIIQGMINDPTIANTYARNSIAYGIFETNIIAGGPGENRTQTNIGAGFMVSTLMKAAQRTIWTQPWFAFWDLYYDTDSNYNMIFPNTSFTLGAQYYALQNMIRCMPGSMATTVSGFGNVLVWATKSGSNFGMALVNGDSTSHTGSVGLSHWPVNTTGNGTLTMWQLDASNYTTGGVTTHPVASAGVLSSGTLPPMSVTMISSP